MKGKISFAIVASLGVMTSACISGAQYGVRRVYRETAKGVRYEVIQAQPLRGDLTAYHRLAVEPLQNQMADQISPELVASLNNELFKQVSRVKRLQVARAESPADRQIRPPTERSAALPIRPPTDFNESQEGPLPDATPSAFQPKPLPAPVKSAMPGRRGTDLPSPGTTPAAVGARTLILRGAIVDYDQGMGSLRVLQVGVARQSVLTLNLWLVDASTGQVLAQYVADSEVYRLKGSENDMVFAISKGIGKLMTDLTEKKNPKSAKGAPEPADQGRSRGDGT